MAVLRFIDENGNWVEVPALKGEKGDAGKTPYIQNGYWYIDGVNTNVKAQGIDGTDGKDGTNGLTPFIGANGNWWIGEEDTGTKAEGVNGKDGINGKDGVNGKDGIDGKNGLDGKDGTDGKTPVRGTDYWTEADKAEIVQEVLVNFVDVSEVGQ